MSGEGKKPSKDESFPYKEFVAIPPPSLQALADLQETSLTKRKMTLSQKKRLLLTLREMQASITQRKEIADHNLQIFQRSEEQQNYRSQREIKDINRLVKIVEKLATCDISVELNHSSSNLVFVTTEHVREDANPSFEQSEYTEKSKPGANQRKRETSPEMKKTPPPKRQPGRDIHHPVRESRRVSSLVSNKSMRSVLPSRMNPDYLNPSRFWNEIDLYYKRFDADQIKMVLGDTQSEFDPDPVTKSSSIMPIDCLLSCLIPEQDGYLPFPCLIPEQDGHLSFPENWMKKGYEDDSVTTAGSRKELEQLNPFIVSELNNFGLVGTSLDIPDYHSNSLSEEICRLKKELSDCINETATYCHSFRDRFLEELKRDISIKEDEDKLNQTFSNVKYL